MRLVGKAAGALAVAVVGATTVVTVVAQAPRSGVVKGARYDAMGRLSFPKDSDRWIGVGASLGGNYAQGAFDPANPGPIGVVQMEPSAYEFFMRNGRYADGTMFLLTFYSTQKNPNPALRGFVQGDVSGREIHVIDHSRFPNEGGAFFLFASDAGSAVAPTPVGSECHQCHSEHGAFEGTFVQFYPAMRARVGQASD